MERRNFVLSIGTLAAGGGLALGTGAFSSVRAERDVAVTVSEDASAYLGVQPGDGPNGNYADTTDSDALAITLTGDNDNVGDGIAGGQGLNANAVTGIEDIFQIQNQGTQEVELRVTPLAFGDVDWQDFDGVLGVLLVPQAGEVGIDLEWPPWESNFVSISTLSPGEEIEFSLAAFALPETAVDSVAVNDEIEITAEEV
ncbi:hypothetical protein HT576_01355 [Haloterrigena sp. SYSU A121-1]|uniref:DUF1102 domain-containing protein n=1 Tax=Haloterrigena gelatinilytica TaxID=2741724 RepID=A0A8J8KE62_9EURY|nr:hypothetical protein [Haloterrigena gelatinilytica]NUB89682.1 hypothetical protein [Haloterrigena gelatinilytica]